MSTFTYQGSHFQLDGKDITLISGTIHYFRVVPEYWRDRLTKLKACGFNAVETYVCWNLHEPREGTYDFSGILDLEKYLSIAHELGLYVILRPTPYICAEWEFGGLPWWLLKYPRMRLRCADPLYLEKFERYLDNLLPRMRPFLCTNGGPIVMMQVENEYGSYGNDKKYLEALKKNYQRNGIDCLLFTSDGPGFFMLNGGTLPDCLATVNFGSRPTASFQLLEKFRPNQPAMCCEYWNGWFDHWYEEHHTRESDDTAEVFGEMLDYGASVNFYMFHGGTNFNFWNGANYDMQNSAIQPTVTSYDYDCPLNEAGDMTPKYQVVKDTIEKRFGKAPELPVANLPKKAYGAVELTEMAPLFQNLNAFAVTHAAAPLTMEELDQAFGYVLYSNTLHGPFEELPIIVDGLHDRAHIFINGEQKGIIERTGKRSDEVKIALGMGETAQLDILVENMGRINYGPRLRDEKGILRGVRLGQQFQFDWTMHAVPCTEELERLNFTAVNPSILSSQPVFLRGTFQADELADTFLRLDGFTKGIAFINGFHIGRYWNAAGPQKTLYIPAPLLRKGENTLLIFETDGASSAAAQLTDVMDLG